MTVLEPGPGESPLEALLRAQGESEEFFWDEDDCVPCSPEEFRAGFAEAVKTARKQGWIPAEDPGCQCLTCRLWRERFDNPARPVGRAT